MSQQPYSIRDLRTIFCGDTLRSTYAGGYDSPERRWRFTSKTARNDALNYVNARPAIGALAIPGISDDRETLSRLGGVYLASRNEQGGYRRGIDIAVFENQDRADEALVDLYARFKCHPRDLKMVEQNFDPKAFADPTAVMAALGSSIAPLAKDTMRWQARLKGYRTFASPDDKSSERSIVDAKAEASTMLRSAYHIQADFIAKAAPITGIISGIVIGRSSHHLAILTDESGEGVIVPRAPLAFPMRVDGTGERSVERLAAIAIDLGTNRAMQSRAQESVANQSVTQGPLFMIARLSAGDLEPIIQDDLSPHEDCNGRIVARNDAYACVLDDAYTTALHFRRNLGNDTIGARISVGPSYAPQTVALHRSR